MSDYTHQRLEARIQETISTMIVTREIKHHGLSPFVSVSQVTLSRDKAYATVWVSSFVEDNKLEQSVAALQSAAGFIQQRLGALMKTRNTPRLTFKADTSIREAQAMNDLIDSLNVKNEE
ncbi:MAG: ribosome-binding factor A [Spirochaetae bacterium HGW-Spirochaetae-4]|jgi:ribosome-binding factor A|nr:MAG: ribosome-binding factor A [Spirochaetes bacterium GWC2_52_13]PKL20547.1 MAG: ribosome-binding factor A [Spirochaetae bacterium HGW-Spirochaetae-4]PKL29532.1 MAG: ribosome-binding factor A [Spirochaetae bacterium HGW-Spirochaetae-2]HCG62397.1 30S ribosome-binding factor RbfA [Sphaerochaeta sp.]